MNIRILNYELREIDPKKWELYELKELDVKKSHRMAHMKGSGLRVEQGTKAWKPTGHYFQSLTPALVFIYHRELRNMGGGEYDLPEAIEEARKLEERLENAVKACNLPTK